METQPLQLQELGLSNEGPTWKDLLGANNWEGLLDPLNLELRYLLLRCGDLCQVTYDTFMNDANSPYQGGSRYSKRDIFEKTDFSEGPKRYNVVEFIYATSVGVLDNSKQSNWMGYVAVTNDELSQKIGRREVYVAWRGTERTDEWMDDIFESELVSAKPLLHPRPTPQNTCTDNVIEDEPKIMLGWLTMYTNENENENEKSLFPKASARTQLLNTVKKLIHQYKDENLSITCVGHSLGAALAVVSIFDVAENLTIGTTIPTTAFVFGCPHVGDNLFKKRLNSHPHLKILHVRNVIDVVPNVPLKIAGYEDIGVELEIFTWKSPYIKKSMNIHTWHNLQGMLHVVNGWHGMKREFNIVIKSRSLALVNKVFDMLVPEYEVPSVWWIEENEGMILNENGQWLMPRPQGYPQSKLL